MDHASATLGHLQGHGHLVVTIPSGGLGAKSVSGSFEPAAESLGAIIGVTGDTLTFEGVIYTASEGRRGRCRVHVTRATPSLYILEGAGAPEYD